jgi:glutathione synthase/RimK-type ligase-like ATP-grasp enzyme
VASNNSKPYQLRLIHSFGFAVPETLVTTDPDVARAFWEKHGEVIYKSISATRSRVSRLLPEHVERLSDVSSCPTQFQEYIPGIDHRVHVIGDEVFACQVLCEADDYRSPGSHTIELQACQLPEEIEDRCWRLTAALQLSLAGIDLRRTPEGRWICFEVNTSPAFTYYEQGTRQPIADAIARHLANGCSGPRLIHPFATPSPDGRTRREPVRSVHAGDHGLAREAPHRH